VETSPAAFILTAALAVAASACDRTQNPVTPSGTVLVDWKSTDATRKTVATATVGAHTSKDYSVTVSYPGAPPFALTAHVETAPVDYVEGTEKVHQLAPVRIAMTVASNSGWDLSGKCLDGPDYEMPSAGKDGGLVTPLGMVESCEITHHRQSGTIVTSTYQLAVTLEVVGDGTVSPFPADGVTVTPR
jgi:hypothetical protein